MTDEDDGTPSTTHKFHSASGRVTGVLALLVVAAVAVLAVAESGSDVSPALLAGCAFLGVLVWAFLLRPAVRVEGPDLVLRGPFDSRRIPLAAVDGVAVAAMLVVTADGRRYTNTGVARSRRQARRDSVTDVVGASYGGLVESRLTSLAEAARFNGEPAGAVRREWAWPELGALVVTALALVVALVL